MNENIFLQKDFYSKNRTSIPKLRLNFNDTKNFKDEDLSSPHENLETLGQ